MRIQKTSRTTAPSLWEMRPTVPVLVTMRNYQVQLALEQHSLNCTSPLRHGFFSIVNTTVQHSLQLVESMDAEELQIQRNCIYEGLTLNYNTDF